VFYIYIVTTKYASRCHLRGFGMLLRTVDLALLTTLATQSSKTHGPVFLAQAGFASMCAQVRRLADQMASLQRRRQPRGSDPDEAFARTSLGALGAAPTANVSAIRAAAEEQARWGQLVASAWSMGDSALWPSSSP
jgi:hypothetical protein